ncbi:hypothetical protein BZG36_04433 [Bifiguratus adelaidae]|uniref:C2H2-type domain-containing protein n=1 Tax=Bifiguratus adelaidae TaxID=1938954 RepID=A0A261XVV9_9FUNG|nr:hypothetical protein BZG36_04433 [Bifiguratus adelaidae]
MRPENAARLAQQPKDADLPGLGQNYCIQCARHFITGKALNEHYRGKVHKKRVKDLKEEAYTQKEAEAAVGFTTDNGTRGGVRKSAVQDAIMTDLDQ